jgi:hypothetical protein
VRRLLSAMCVSVILGGIATLAIAWVCPVVFHFSESRAVFVVDKPNGWPPDQCILIRRATAAGVEQLAFTSTAEVMNWWPDFEAEQRETPPDLPAWAPWPDPQDLPEYWTDNYVASGWPFKCAVARRREYDVRWANSSPPRRARTVLEEAEYTWHCAIVLDVQTSGGPFSTVVIPFGFRPIETAANIATLAGGLLVLSSSCWVTRYCQRRLRGRCPACGYHLCGRLASGCPECGWHRPPLEAPQQTSRVG